jgi:hypothetical protein
MIIYEWIVLPSYKRPNAWVNRATAKQAASWASPAEQPTPSQAQNAVAVASVAPFVGRADARPLPNRPHYGRDLSGHDLRPPDALLERLHSKRLLVFSFIPIDALKMTVLGRFDAKPIESEHCFSVLIDFLQG